ncbi:hypothetical protein BBP40_011806, partial [Aspergillus hancockii]
HHFWNDSTCPEPYSHLTAHSMNKKPNLSCPTGPEADVEWNRIGSGVRPIVISSAKTRKLGKDPAKAVKIPEELGYGSDAYIAWTEVFHLLHCVDILRRHISYNHYYGSGFGDETERDHHAHMSHCIEILAEDIKCSSKLDPILYVWVEGTKRPSPAFSNAHVCRDFVAVLNYINENAVPAEVFDAMTEPPAGYEVVAEFDI